MDEPTESQKPKGRTSGLAKCSLALGILGIFPLGIFAAAPAVICGHMALSRIKRSDGGRGGRRLAIAGLIIGYLAIGLIPVKFFAIKASRESARELMCCLNMREIALAHDMYTMENEGSLPASLDQLERYVATSVEQTQEGLPNVFVCPSAADKSTPSYEIVPQSETKVHKLVSGTVIIREKHANHRAKRCVAYVDGQVEMVSE